MNILELAATATYFDKCFLTFKKLKLGGKTFFILFGKCAGNRLQIIKESRQRFSNFQLKMSFI